jgi:hypothetical protein
LLQQWRFSGAETGENGLLKIDPTHYCSNCVPNVIVIIISFFFPPSQIGPFSPPPQPFVSRRTLNDPE